MIVFLVIGLAGSAYAQTSEEPVTIGIFKPKKGRLEYRFNNTDLSKVFIKMVGPQKKTYTGGEMAQDVINDVLVQALGGILSSGSSRDMEWELKGKLVCNNEAMNWEVLLFCEGEFEKEKELIKNDDGSTSVQTTKRKFVHWDKGATGVILENEVPIGGFGLFMNPRADSLIYTTYKEAFIDQPEQIKTTSKNNYYIESIDEYIPEYAVLGKFRGEQFTLIANGDSRRMWFYINNKLQWIFKTDVDNLLPIRKKDRFMPSLQIQDSSTDLLPDWFRMALVSKYLSSAILQDEY